MSNNALGCSSRWLVDGELWGVRCSTNTTSHTPELTVHYQPRTTSQGIITH